MIPAPSLIPNFVRYHKFSETKKGSSTKVFSTVGQNYFDGKSWYPPLLSSLTFFDTRNFLKLRRVPLRNFSALWDKTILTENRDTRPSLLSLTFFDTRNFLKLRKVPLRKFSALWDKIILTENRDTRPFSHPKHFSIPETFWTWEGFLYETFRHSETKQFWLKIVIPALSLIPNIFRYQKSSETKKASCMKFFSTVRQNSFDGKSWYPPPLLYLTCFDTKNFLKLRKVPLPNNSVLWDKTILTENRDTHPLFIQKFTGNFL